MDQSIFHTRHESRNCNLAKSYFQTEPKQSVDSATQQRADGRVLLPLFEIAIIKSNIRPDDEEYVPGEHALHSDALVLPGDG